MDRAWVGKYNSVSVRSHSIVESFKENMLRSLPCVKSNAKATPGPTEIMDHQSLSFSSDLSAIVSESVG